MKNIPGSSRDRSRDKCVQKEKKVTMLQKFLLLGFEGQEIKDMSMARSVGLHGA